MTDEDMAIIVAGTVRTLHELGVPLLEIACNLAGCAAAMAEQTDDPAERERLCLDFRMHLRIMEESV